MDESDSTRTCIVLSHILEEESYHWYNLKKMTIEISIVKACDAIPIVEPDVLARDTDDELDCPYVK